MSDRTNRREFLQGSALAAATVAGVGVGGSGALAASCCKPKREAVLKLSSQEGVMAGKDLDEKLDNMEKWGYVGLELHGGRFFDAEACKVNAETIKTIKQALSRRTIRISAICAGFSGCLISQDEAERAKAMNSMKEILTGAGELGAVGMIIVPAFNKQTSMPHQEARQLLTGFARWDEKDRKREGALLAELGDHAEKAGTRILLEPLNRHECYFMRTLADAASICKDVESPGIAMMGDFWHMTWEETSDLGAFVSAGDYVHHVHIASRRRRKTPGEDGEADNYVAGLRGLKMIGYQDYISLECGSVGDKNAVIRECAELLRKQWAEA